MRDDQQIYGGLGLWLRGQIMQEDKDLESEDSILAF